MKVTPDTPSAILNELGNAVVGHIEARALSSFEDALREMTDYNRLLFDLYATTSNNGTPDSYAIIEESWRPLYREWLANYRRIVQRAAARLDDDPEFLGSAVYIPRMLIPGRTAVAPQIVQGILDLGPTILHQLEGWLLRQRGIGRDGDVASQAGLPFAGAVEVAYEDALLAFTGAWESLVHYTTPLRERNEDMLADPSARWDTLTGAWPFYFGHLANTAYAFVLAVWNEDKIGTERFRDMLLRWREVTNPLRRQVHALTHGEFVGGDLAGLAWPAAQEALRAHLPAVADEAITPDGLFATLLSNAYEHAILIAAGVVLNWHLQGKAGDFAITAAGKLLDREVIDTDEGIDWGGNPVPSQFSSRLWNLISLDLAGRFAEERQYNASLDHLATSLDRLRERKVSSGRIFRPSTIHDRHGLIGAYVLMLEALATEAGVEAAVRSIRAFAEDDSRLPYGDRTLRDLQRFLQNLDEAASSLEEGQHEVALRLNPLMDQGAERLLHRLRANVYAITQEVRTERIRSGRVDPDRLRAVADHMERQLLERDGMIGVFQDIAFSTQEGIPVDKEFSLTGVEAAQFLIPPLADQSDRYLELVAEKLSDALGLHVWPEDFFTRPTREAEVRFAPDDPTFWRELAEMAAQVGPSPAFMMPSNLAQLLTRKFVWGRRDQADHGLNVIRNRERAGSRNMYVVTIEGIDIYRVNTDTPATGTLFSALSLEAVTYAVAGEGGRAIDLTFTQDVDDPWRGALTARFGRQITWTDAPIISVTFSLPADDEDT